MPGGTNTTYIINIFATKTFKFVGKSFREGNNQIASQYLKNEACEPSFFFSWCGVFNLKVTT